MDSLLASIGAELGAELVRDVRELGRRALAETSPELQQEAVRIGEQLVTLITAARES